MKTLTCSKLKINPLKKSLYLRKITTLINTLEMKIKKLLLCVFGLFSLIATSQTKEDVEKIVKTYDLEKIKEKEIELRNSQVAKKQQALKLAKINNWQEFIKNPNGTTDELMDVTSDGFPLYYSNNNIAAARSTRANHLNAGGSLGLSLDGEGMVPRVWDGGTVRRTHNALSGRVTTADDAAGTTYSDHATHVSGTIMAINLAPSNVTKGMASKATARTFNWTNDESEALVEVQAGMLLSNHSYGVPITSGSVSQPAWYIGAYTDNAKAWDEISYLSPYYLPVMSAGNDGTNNNNTNPIAAGYDKLTSNKTAKNILVVANANDATIAADGTLTSVTINTSSSQGPTDDRRIKPDITGNGTNLTSCISTSNTATDSYTGTSMSSPNVTGTLVLVQQHHKNITGGFMKAATLKGLACHTADDAGNPGPDAKFGWGLLNAKKAVETLNQNGLQSWVSEETLSQGQSFTKTVSAVGGTTPLIASITWVDVAGVARTSTSPVNDITPVLVNDLDIRITRGAFTGFPWKLQSNPTLNAVNTGDNNVDNVERINVTAPATGGDYVITVTHKGNIVNNNQNFSLVITGVTSTFSINPTSDNVIVCDNQNAVYNFDYKQTGGGTTNFTALGLPAGAVASFNNNSLSANGTVIMTISGLSNVAAGEYTIGIQASNGTETEARNRTLRVYKNTYQNTVLTTPVNNQNPVATTVTLNWNKDVNAESYRVEVATNSNFATIVSTSTVTTNSKIVTGLNQETPYYWRVFPINRCGEGTNPTVFTFYTGKVTCGSNNYSATDFTNAHINSTVDSFASVPIVVTDDIRIGDLNVVLDITHTWIGDMIISLTGPAAIGSPEIILLNQPCAGANPTYPDIRATLDDSGVIHGCSATSPVVSGTIKPFESLTNFNELSALGTWTLNVHDVGPGDAGDINVVTLNFCKLEALPLSINDNIFNKMDIYPNPTKGLLNINLNTLLEGETMYTIYDIQGRKIMHKSSNNTSETLNIENFSNGVYMLSIENGNNKTTKKILLSK